MSTESNLQRIGTISEKSDREIECTIENFFSYTEENKYYRSQDFRFAKSKRWYLEVCPNARTAENCEGWISLHLCKRGDFQNCMDPEVVYYTFGVKKVDGRVEHFLPAATFKFDEFTEELKVGYPQFLERAFLLRRRSELAPSDSLTLTFTWWMVQHLECLGSFETLSRELVDLFTSKIHSDATLRVNGKDFPVHKSILSARSPVLATMFEVDMKEKKTGIVEISGCDPKVFEEFLMYLYSGYLPPLLNATRTEISEATCGTHRSCSNVFELYKIADIYDVPVLKSYCRTSILEELTADNVLDAYLLGHQFDEYYITVKAKDFFNQHFPEITRTPEWDEFLSGNMDIANELIKGSTSNQLMSSLRPPTPLGQGHDSVEIDEKSIDREEDEEEESIGMEKDEEENTGMEKDEKESIGMESDEESIGKIFVKSDHEFEWTIDNFFSYTEKDAYLCSPSVSLSHHDPGAWYLQVHPNGSAEEFPGYGDCTGWISLHLGILLDSSSLPEGVCFTFGLKKIDGTVEQFSPEATWVFDKGNESEVGHPKFLKRSMLLQRRSEMAASGSLTLICTLWTSRHLEFLESLDALSRDLVNLFTSKRSCDAALDVTGREFSVHKSILSARSSVLGTMFDVVWKEKRTGNVEISDFDPQAFEEFLMYLYSGKIIRTEIGRATYRMYSFSSDAFELYKIADKYGVPILKSYCRISLLRHMDFFTYFPNDIVRVILLGYQFNDHYIIFRAQDHFKEYFHVIKDNSRWKKFLFENEAVANELLEGVRKAKSEKK